MKIQHPVHGECEVVDKNEITANTKTVLVRTAAGANLYLSTKWLPVTAPEAPTPESEQ